MDNRTSKAAAFPDSSALNPSPSPPGPAKRSITGMTVGELMGIPVWRRAKSDSVQAYQARKPGTMPSCQLIELFRPAPDPWGGATVERRFRCVTLLGLSGAIHHLGRS